MCERCGIRNVAKKNYNQCAQCRPKTKKKKSAARENFAAQAQRLTETASVAAPPSYLRPGSE
jgi:hypothetical protein